MRKALGVGQRAFLHSQRRATWGERIKDPRNAAHDQSPMMPRYVTLRKVLLSEILSGSAACPMAPTGLREV